MGVQKWPHKNLYIIYGWPLCTRIFSILNRNAVELVIRLTDVNDNPPIFEQKEYVGFLKENSLVFEQPVFVSARDADENGTENSVVRYR